jgi:fructoselysine-6-P-deglycase FrlB-like protein/hydroxymethylpyrimidine pyrophosphatase-like HAD family hydrolase
MGKRYSDEVAEIPAAVEWAMCQPIDVLARGISAIGDLSLFAVGSGGSYTAAAFAAALHEGHFGRLSRAVTPLEALSLPNSMSGCAVLFLSAEGRNKDILAAAEVMAPMCSEGIALTLTASNPLSTYCNLNGHIHASTFEMTWGKDGYLATNSLIATMVLVARAYSRASIDTAALHELNVEWLQERRRWYENHAAVHHLSGCLRPIVLYGTTGRIAALDLESKFSESGFGNCQIADYRQFAHGRHLQLTGIDLPTIIALGSQRDQKLIDATLALMPSEVKVVRISLPEDPIVSEIVGVIEAIVLIEALAVHRRIDVGQPLVEQFGRDMYGMDVRQLFVVSPQPRSAALVRKIPPFGPSLNSLKKWNAAGTDFQHRLGLARIKGIVLDFDGTCCETAKRFAGMDDRIVKDVSRLATAGVKIAFATGRGKSLRTDLLSKLSLDVRQNIVVGYYSGSIIGSIDDELLQPEADPRLFELVAWLTAHDILCGPAAVDIRGGQLGISASQKTGRDKIVCAVRYWIDENRRYDWRVFCSGHSVDVLTEDVGKLKVVDFLSSIAFANSSNELLRIGDSGQLGGNDFELLGSGLSLSVANVSPQMTGCWNLLPWELKGVSGTSHYLGGLEVREGIARFSEAFLSQIGIHFSSSTGH